MQRTRSAPATSSTEAGPSSLPEELPALSVLLEQARAPGAARPEVDALLAGLSQPLPSGASPRERADLLLSLIQDTRIAGYTGTDGRTVRVAAAQALVALGYPYALEVPPEALEESARGRRTGAGRPSTENAQGGFWLVILAGCLQSALVLHHFSTEEWLAEELFLSMAIALVAGTTFLPAFLTMRSHKQRKGGPNMGGIVLMVLSSLLWLIPGLFGLLTSFNPLPLAAGGLLLAGAMFMRSKD